MRLVRDSRNCDSREAGNWSINRYLSESSQTHSEKIRADLLAFPGQEQKNTWKQ